MIEREDWQTLNDNWPTGKKKTVCSRALNKALRKPKERIGRHSTTTGPPVSNTGSIKALLRLY
jgi:hypothetical protein